MGLHGAAFPNKVTLQEQGYIHLSVEVERRRTTQVLQVSDTHLVLEGALVSSALDTAGLLRRLVVLITELQEEVEALDAKFVSGDVSDDGSNENYELF